MMTKCGPPVSTEPELKGKILVIIIISIIAKSSPIDYSFMVSI